MAQLKKLGIVLAMFFIGLLAVAFAPWPGRDARGRMSYPARVATARRATARKDGGKKKGKRKARKGDGFLSILSMPEAIACDNEDAVRMLIAYGAKVGAKDQGGREALHYAAFRNARKSAVLLLENGAEVNAQCNSGYNPLLYAVKSKPMATETATMLIRRGADVDAQSKGGWTPLHYAANFGRLKIAALLIKRGANVNAQSDLGKTPLYIAVERKSLRTVNLLLKHRADPNIKNRKEIWDKEGWAPLVQALLLQNRAITSALLESGADIDCKGNGGWRPLHYAISFGSRKMVELLIERGADINALNDKGKTPLDLAIDRDQHDIAAFLCEHGGKVGEDLSS